MKYNKIFRTLAFAIILTLLMVAIPVTPALAAESLSVSPTKGAVGDEIDVSGSGTQRVVRFISTSPARKPMRVIILTMTLMGFGKR